MPYLLIDLENKRVKITSNTPGDEQTVVNKLSDVEYCVVRATKIQSALIQQILKLNGSPTAFNIGSLAEVVQADTRTFPCPSCADDIRPYWDLPWS